MHLTSRIVSDSPQETSYLTKLYLPTLTFQTRSFISMERTLKRRRLEDKEFETPESLTRPVSPPNKKRRHVPAVNSPWQLTWIRDLPDHQNQDAVTLKGLLGDPLISECWEFNFLHDIHFLMDAFDPDTRHLVQVNVVHGFWKRGDPNRQALQVSQCKPA